jgi:hypothetical protein
MTGDFAPYTSTGGSTTFGYIHCEDLKNLLVQKADALSAESNNPVTQVCIGFEKKMTGEVGMRFAVMLDRVVCMVVQRSGLAYKAGLREGDVLMTVNGIAIQADVTQVVHQIRYGKYPMRMDVERNGRLEGKITNGRLVVREFKPLGAIGKTKSKPEPVSLDYDNVSIPFSWLKELCHHLPPESGIAGSKGSTSEGGGAIPPEISGGERVREGSDTATLINRYREYIVDVHTPPDAKSAENGGPAPNDSDLIDDFKAMLAEGRLNREQYAVAMQELSTFDAEVKTLGTESLVKVAQDFV